MKKSLISSRSLFFCHILIVFLFAVSVYARNPIRKEFFKAYPSANNTRLDNVPSNLGHCGVCHYDFDGGGTRNLYGQAVEATANRDKDDILGLDGLDSDGDGFSNGTEITDTSTYSNTPTFPGLTPANFGQVSNVSSPEIQNHLVPSAGVDTTPPTVTVISPNGGENLTANSATTILWDANDAGGVAGIDIFLSEDNGVSFRTLAEGIADSGSFTWYPANRPTPFALIRVVATDNSFNSAQDDSNTIFVVSSPSGGLVPTTLRDFDLPGSQPFESGTLNDPEGCRVCHGDYDQAVEPYYNWQGSMMAQASLDPIFKANMVIANQDAPDSGDLCIRCHFPRGWLQGRSVPTDGSAILPEDNSGVSCDLCHRLIDPNNEPQNPAEDQAILAAMISPATGFGNGMYNVDPTGARRGPFLDATSGHPVLVSPFHKEAALCGTCHDVSNPAFENDGFGNFPPNALDTPPADMSPKKVLAVERTYSEWLNSAFNSPSGVYSPQFGGNKDFVSTCQDCHMKDVTGQGCNFGSPPTRTDLPLHDMTGGSAWLSEVLTVLHPNEVNAQALLAGAARSRALLQNAAQLSAEQLSGDLKVTVINKTGHKLPTGYPEGRRMWINVKYYDGSLSLLSESAIYNSSTGELGHDLEAKIYEVKPAIASDVASLTGLPAGPSFHFVLNNTVAKDNRIPPQGFTNAAFDEFGGSPVAHSYADGQFWDDTFYSIPQGAESAEVTLFYQSTSKEFVEFLRDENTTNDLGQQMYDIWNNNGKCPPELMAQTTIFLAGPPPGDFDHDFDVDKNDLDIFSDAWLASTGGPAWNPDCDINMPTPDGIINFLDFAVIYLNWLTGVQ